MMLLAFQSSPSLHTKGHSGAEKNISKFYTKFLFPNGTDLDKNFMQWLHNMTFNKPYPNQKQIAEKRDFKAQNSYFNHRISFDTKGPISPSSEGNSFIIVTVDAFTHFVALNPVPPCNAYYAYTTL